MNMRRLFSETIGAVLLSMLVALANTQTTDQAAREQARNAVRLQLHLKPDQFLDVLRDEKLEQSLAIAAGGKNRSELIYEVIQAGDEIRGNAVIHHISTDADLTYIIAIGAGSGSTYRSKGYAPVSIRRKFATARVFFSYWVRKKEIDISPLWRIRLDLGRERVLPRSLTPSDAKLLMEAVWRGVGSDAPSTTKPVEPCFRRLRNLASLEVLFATGIRVGELVSLSLTDWQEDDKSFVIKGKGSRQRLAFLPDDRSVRAVQMYLAARQAMNLGHDAMFVNAVGRPISTQGIARIVGETARIAGLAVRVTPHMIRHTVATLLLRFGADIRIVQEVLGHASIATTQRYTHVSKEHLVSALRLRHPNYHLKISIPTCHTALNETEAA